MERLSPGFMVLDFCCDIQIIISEFGVNNTEATCLASMIQAGGGGVIHEGYFLSTFWAF